jgi:PAS domain S-box-containing protein
VALLSKISDIDQLACRFDIRVHHRVMAVTLLWLVLLPVLSVFFLRLTAQSFVKPINELARYIIQLGAGDLDTPPAESLRSCEFRYLTETLDEMAKNLKRTMVSRQELAKSQALLETILLGITDGIISTDMEGKVVYANKQARWYFAWPDCDMIGRNYREVVDQHDFFEEDGSQIPPDQTVLAQALRGVSQLPRQIRRRKKNGKPEDDRWAIVQGISLCDEHAKLSVVVVVTRDITEQKRTDLLMEQQRIQLAHSARLSSVGVMAAGIAHEINNPLAVIQRRAEQIVEGLDEKEVNPVLIRNYAEKIVGFSRRISKIIRSLKSMSRDGEHDAFEPAPIRALIDDCLELCREKFRNHGVDLQVDLPESELLVECRSAQVAQVLLNLINNAFDAVESLPGTATKWVRVGVARENGEVVIRVADSGAGIPLELRRKVGIPFFTTKEAGKGTGLGLSVSRQIMQLHHGSLKLDPSSPSTCFVIRLPEKQPLESAQAA